MDDSITPLPEDIGGIDDDDEIVMPDTTDSNKDTTNQYKAIYPSDINFSHRY